MKPLVLLILAVVWGVALIPPLLRSRSELRPNSSVASFRRTLSDMSRIPGRNGTRGMVNPASPVRAFRASPGQPSAPAQSARQLSRVSPGRYPTYGYAPGVARARANRAVMIRRRQNVLFTLVTAVVVTGIVGFALGIVVARTAFFVCLILLSLYVWMLATLRRNEEMRSAQRYVYSDAA
ncbi:MAG TPA: hypothetical protein VF076_08970 [Acidimicrobiales bacterium]